MLDTKTSVQLAEYISRDKVELGKNKTPGVTVKYKRIDIEEPKEMSVNYLIGKLDDVSVTLLQALKPGDKFVVNKHAVNNPKDSSKPFWNLTGFTDISTWKEKPKKEAYTPGKPYEKKEFDQTGVKVGAARNQAIALLTSGKFVWEKITGDVHIIVESCSLDEIDKLAYEIVQRQAKQEDNVRKGIFEDAPEKLTEDNFTRYQDLDLDGDIEHSHGDEIPW